MTAQRSLVLGAIPPDATPETHSLLGPWCVTGNEAAFPAWDTRFPLPPDPYPTHEAMEQAAWAANREMLRVIPILAEELNAARGTRHSLVFWETALAPWLMTTLHSLCERHQRLQDYIALHGTEPLRVALLPEQCPVSFRNSLEFMIHGVQDVAYNHYVFSRLLEGMAPAAWTLEYLEPRALHQAAPRQTGGLKAHLKEHAQDLLRHLPFPRVKGFAPWQVLLFSLALAMNRKDNDRTIPLAVYCGPGIAVREQASSAFPFDSLPFLRRCMPRDLVEAPIPVVSRKRGGIRVMAAEFIQNEAYGLRLAAWREGGGRLIDIQHGANNGNLRCMGATVLDYRQHAHITWGWSEQTGYAVNAHPLVHPLPMAVAGKHKEAKPELILVGTEMSTFAYRLKSRPLGGAQVNYRKEKVNFFAALPDAVRANALYRPYFIVAGGLADAPYVQAAFPTVGLCTGDLMERLLACRLAVLDHYGTTMLLALAANIPLICYWDQKRWGMDAGSEACLEPLRAAGILHADAASAAAKAAEVWDTTAAWWNSAAVQAARSQWTRRYAVTDAAGPCDLTRRWVRVLSSL